MASISPRFRSTSSCVWCQPNINRIVVEIQLRPLVQAPRIPALDIAIVNRKGFEVGHAFEPMIRFVHWEFTTYLYGLAQCSAPPPIPICPSRRRKWAIGHCRRRRLCQLEEDRWRRAKDEPVFKSTTPSAMNLELKPIRQRKSTHKRIDAVRQHRRITWCLSSKQSMSPRWTRLLTRAWPRLTSWTRSTISLRQRICRDCETHPSLNSRSNWPIHNPCWISWPNPTILSTSCPMGTWSLLRSWRGS